MKMENNKVKIDDVIKDLGFDLGVPVKKKYTKKQLDKLGNRALHKFMWLIGQSEEYNEEEDEEIQPE